MPAKVLGGIDYSRLSDKIWSYPIRTVTKYVDVNDRGHGYVSDKVAPYVVMRERRGIKSGTKFMLVGNAQPFFLGDETNDLLPGATKTVLQTGFDDTNLRDHDDSTCAYPAGNIRYGSTYDLVKYDFRSVGYRFVYVKMWNKTDPWVNVRVLISNDDVNYNVLAQLSGSLVGETYTGVLGATFRYIKLQIKSDARETYSNSLCCYYTVEVYWPSTTSTVYYSDNASRLMQCYVSKGYYQLLEVIEA